MTTTITVQETRALANSVLDLCQQVQTGRGQAEILATQIQENLLGVLQDWEDNQLPPTPQPAFEAVTRCLLLCQDYFTRLVSPDTPPISDDLEEIPEALINGIPLTPSPPIHPSIQNAELTQTIRNLDIELVLQQPLGNPNLIWDGVTLSKTFSASESIHRYSLVKAAEQGDWAVVLRDGSRINETRLDDPSFDTLLHQAASQGAPLRVVRKMVEMGAWRTLRNARGQKPVDVARSLGHTHLVDALEPVCRRSVPEDLLRQIEANFHDVIQGRVSKLVAEHALRLPQLGPLLELGKVAAFWFAVPGMYGGFAYHLEGEGEKITAEGSQLVDEGFA
ncbi:hypothetical protein BC938DRAFT_471164 [Jimgerdemannia flammicorona]|uniref:Uncharacterized protein n=1 Tax=Jimgerdemannia flammicorona TaxID=994334 RepID=A0A433Q8Q2_9FUNG|nr:hypothetical protein BC938DRAFT_471164 [Jimgerdemannia flammicorona]